MLIPVTVTSVGNDMEGALYQAAVTQIDGQAHSREDARAAFVADWNTKTGEQKTEADFDFTDQ